MMATSLEDFSYFFFWPLIILGAWCLFEGETILLFGMNIDFEYETIVLFPEMAVVYNKKSWPLPYRWAEVPWIMEVRATLSNNIRLII